MFTTSDELILEVSTLDDAAPLQKARKQLMSHPLYRRVSSLQDLRIFMEDHVFAVWDFMTLAKRLQRDLTCITLPWLPSADPKQTRFINEIILAEESDVMPGGSAASHLEIYLSAMDEVGASRKVFDYFLESLHDGMPVPAALKEAKVPAHVAAFVNHTIQTAREGSTLEVCASFLYGREDAIPEMFQRLIKSWPDSDVEAPLFRYYLERHIELDGDDHGPAARKMLGKMIDGDPFLWNTAAKSAQRALQLRLYLWQGTYTRLASAG